MHSYLVCAACLEDALDERHMSKRLDYTIMSHGTLALGAVERKSRHLQAVFGRPAYVGGNSPFCRLGRAPHHGDILALGGLIEKLPSEVSLGIGGFGYYEQARCIFVDAVHKAQARVVDVVVGRVAEVPRKGVDQCPVVVAVSRVYH